VVPKENLNLKMEKLVGLLKREGAQLNVEAKFGVTFMAKSGVLASILKSGIMITTGTNSKEETLDFYKEIVVDGMEIPWACIR